MKSLQAIIAATALASSTLLAQPSITTQYATNDVAGAGFVFSETPVAKTKVTLENNHGYVNFQQVARTNAPRKFFYNVAGIGTSYDLPKANVAIEFDTVNVGGFGRTNELWMKATAKAPLSPALEYICDSGADSGQYAALSISKNGKVGDVNFGVEAAVGYNHNLSRDMSGFSHARLDLTASKQVTPHLSVEATARLQKAISKLFTEEQMYQASATYKF